MKGRYWAALLAGIAVICAILSAVLLGSGGAAGRAEVRSQGVLVRVVDLHVDQEFTVQGEGGYNTVTVRGGKIAVTDADCPDGYCVARGFCGAGRQIVCLPHGLVITFLGEREVDAAVG